MNVIRLVLLCGIAIGAMMQIVGFYLLFTARRSRHDPPLGHAEGDPLSP